MNFGVSNLFFELALIFLPGFICMKIHTRYGAKGEPSQFDLILNAFIFGVISYAILDVIYKLSGSELRIFSIDTSNTKLLQPDMLPEIIYAIGISVIIGIMSLYNENYKLFTRLVQKNKSDKDLRR